MEPDPSIITLLRSPTLDSASAMVAFLQLLLQIASEVHAVDPAAASPELVIDAAGVKRAPVLTLTRLLQQREPEFVPAMLKNLVADIDSIACDAAGSGWDEDHRGDFIVRRQLRRGFARRSLQSEVELFELALAYVRSHY